MRYEVTALRKSAAILRALADADGALGVSEVARRAGVAKNMAYRVLMTLADLGWAEAESGGRGGFRLTLAPFRLFSRPLERATLTAASQEPLAWLAARTGETVFVGIRDGLRAMNVLTIEGTGNIRVAGRVGSAFELHCTSQGKVLLAGAEPEVLARLTAKPLPRHTAATITSPAKLARHLEQVRRQGYALNQEEMGAGLMGCAAPILDPARRTVAAIGVFAPTLNVDAAKLRRVVLPAVLEAAKRASLNLGASSSAPS
jgi:DNA-binding IclR family transcriptional regulator